MQQVKRSAFTTLPISNKRQRQSPRLNKIHTSQLNSHAFYTPEAYRNELSRPSITSIEPINIMRSKSNKTICFFATEHSSDQTHTQFQLFKTHLSDSKPPDIIISELILNSEAFLNQYTEYSKTEPKDNVAEQFLKTSFRECGYAAALVLQKNPKCKLLCPEPSKEAIGSYLCKYYSPEKVFCYEMAELIMTYYHLKTDDSLRQWIDKSFKNYKKSMVERNPSFWRGFNFSCANFTRLFKGKIIAELDTIPTKDRRLYTDYPPQNKQDPFDESNKNFFSQLHNPSLSDSFINRMAFNVSLQRDNNLCQMVNDQLAAGHQRILIVYGKGHFGVNERSLQTILNHY